jgi:hypothetical protein
MALKRKMLKINLLGLILVQLMYNLVGLEGQSLILNIIFNGFLFEFLELIYYLHFDGAKKM